MTALKQSERIITVLVANGCSDYSGIFRELLPKAMIPSVSEWRVVNFDSVAKGKSSIYHNPEIDVIIFHDSGELGTFSRITSAVPYLPVIVLSDPGNEQSALEFIQNGAQDYLLTNALDPDFVARIIVCAIARHACQKAFHPEINAYLRLIQAQKHESISRLSKGIAHEIKNPLAILQMGIDFFRRQNSADDARVSENLSMMKVALRRADQIVIEMAEIAKPRDMVLDIHDLNDLVKAAMESVKSDLEERSITVNLDLLEELPRTRVDREMIKQILLNLLKNAMQASDPGSEIELKTSLVSLEDIISNPGQRSLVKVRGGHKVLLIEIRDYGEGIAEENLVNIFDPFFTTKPTGEGVGLGLSICKTLVESHNGRIRVKNTTPNGVRAEVFLHPC